MFWFSFVFNFLFLKQFAKSQANYKKRFLPKPMVSYFHFRKDFQVVEEKDHVHCTLYLDKHVSKNYIIHLFQTSQSAGGVNAGICEVPGPFGNFDLT